MEVFETDRPEVAEARCRELQMSYRWLSSGYLATSTVRPAALHDAQTGESMWFNQAHLFRLSPRWMGHLHYWAASILYFHREGRGRDAQYGDGSTIEPAALDHIFDVLEQQTVACHWERGDLLLVDNLACMHGRNPFTGSRRVLVSMTG